MPRAFTQCASNPRSHIVTIHPSKSHRCDYLRVCYLNGKAHRGEIHHKHGCHGKRDGASGQKQTPAKTTKPHNNKPQSVDAKHAPVPLTAVTKEQTKKRIGPSVIITVPHATCKHFRWRIGPHGRLIVYHTCDVAAVEAARLLATSLAERLPPDSYIITLPSPDPRHECDDNRKQCRHTKYRKHVTRLFKQQLKANPGNVWSVDVHSFPPGTDSFNDAKGGQDPLIALLDNDDGKAIGKTTQHLQTYLNDHKIATNVFKGSEENDIARFALSLGVSRSYLIEFNESLSENPEREVYLKALSDGEDQSTVATIKERMELKQRQFGKVASIVADGLAMSLP